MSIIRCKYIEPHEIEEKHLQLRSLGQQLGIPVPEMYLEMMVTMPDGSITHWHKQRSHSWTRNAYNVLLSEMAALNAPDATFAAAKISMKDTGGTIRSGAFPAQLTAVNLTTPGNGYIGGAGVSSNGIQVGSGTNAESFEDYVLQTIIANGTGAGQISYTQSDATVTAYDVPSKTWTITLVRYFNNNSGGTISVNEVSLVGLYLQAGYSAMASRDHLSSTVSVLNTGQLKVTYTMTLVFPG